MERRQRTQLLSAGVVAVVFGSGVAVGMAFGGPELPASPDQLEVAETPGEAPSTERSDEERPRQQQSRPLYEQVGLTEVERARADSLVRVHRAAVRVLQTEFRRASDSLLDASGLEVRLRQGADSLLQDLRGGIKDLMSPEQRIMYDSLLAADDLRRAQQREGRSGPGRER